MCKTVRFPRYLSYHLCKISVRFCKIVIMDLFTTITERPETRAEAGVSPEPHHRRTPLDAPDAASNLIEGEKASGSC